MEMLDALGALALAESMVQSRVVGDPSSAADAAGALAQAQAAAENGARVALVASAERLSTLREAMRRVAQARLGLVAHAIAGHGGEDLAALADLGWGVLCASGPEDSFDLALVARRAAEDSGVPFVVVHALGRSSGPVGRALAMVAIPQDRGVHSFVGPASRVRATNDPAHPSRSPVGDRGFAERVPFALGAALREYGSVSGRRHDVFDKVPLGDAPLVLVGIGPVGDALFCATGELRTRGYDVGAVHLSVLRPFPGPRLVKALARALAITVLEPADEPLAHGGPLARELKSAFTDALTWVPGFPGIGRIPKLYVGATGPAFDVADLAAICDNMLADERGKRTFSFADPDHALPRPAWNIAIQTRPEREVSMRWVLDDLASAEAALMLTSSAFAASLGLRVHGIVTHNAPDATATVDVLASRDYARGGMARRGPRLVLATERGAARAGAVARLAEGALLTVLTKTGDLQAALPDAVRTMVRDRRARVLPLAMGADDDAPVGVAATIVGASIAVGASAIRAPIDGAFVARFVAEQLVDRGLEKAEAAGDRARRAFEATREVVAVTEREEGATDPGRPIGVA
jgi:pyruvate ferredoxin oxidoreductase alpha subunit